MERIVGWNAGNDGTVAVVFWPATTVTPVICVKYPTPPPVNPSNPTVYVPGASASMVAVAPGATVTVLLVGPLTTT